MSYWFYQLNQQRWEPGRFRIEVWENEPWSWTVGRAILEGEEPRAGDSVAFFYAPTGGDDPGFFAWAVVLEWYKDHDGEQHISFRPAAPANHLKMHPWWNDEARTIADEVRGRMMKRTLWLVPDELWKRIREGITGWVSGLNFG